MISPEALRDLQLPRRPRGSYDRGTKRLGHLHCRQTYSPSSSVHQDIVPLLDARSRDQSSITGRRGDHQARRVQEPPSRRNGPQPLLFGAYPRRVSTLRRAEDSISNFVFRRGGVGWSGQDDACEFAAGDPGEWGLVLVFAADLEEVEEVGRGGVDRDQVLGGGGVRIGEAGDGELVGPLAW